MLSVQVLSLDEFLAQMCPYESGFMFWAQMSPHELWAHGEFWALVSCCEWGCLALAVSLSLCERANGEAEFECA